jgi:acetyltransferase-like isoleucine patch superfamily enzyme
MASDNDMRARLIKAVHGVRGFKPDPDFEIGLSDYLRAQYARETLIDHYARFSIGDSPIDDLMRRAIWRALAKSFGQGVRIGSGVGFKHPETFEIGNSVFVGAQAYIQGRFDGRCVIGDHVWIGPQSYFDARDLILEEYVGWGPGAKVLGSSHTGIPIDLPIIQTDLVVKTVRIGAWADIGTNAVILPGVTVGKGSIVGAGSVVTKDVDPYAIVGGVPAKFLGWRKEYKSGEEIHGDQE